MSERSDLPGGTDNRAAIEDTSQIGPASNPPVLPGAGLPADPGPQEGQSAAAPASPFADPAQPAGAAPGYAAAQQPDAVPGYAAQPAGGAPGFAAGSAGMPGNPPTSVYGPNPPSWTPAPVRPAGAGSTIVKWVVGSVAAIALALCSGIVGAVVVTQLGDDNPVITSGDPTAAAPIMDRGSLAGVAAKVQPSVVSIAAGRGQGSGVVLTKDGYILTNNHVVESSGNESLTVTLSSGSKVPARVVGTDAKTDIAVIKADASELSKAVFADSDAVNVGDTVLAIGSPLGLDGSVTAGIISAKDRTIGVGQNRGSSISGLLQTDAPINPGNSGGALVNTNGEVVGINTAIATGGSGDGNIGLGFAIPSNKAKHVGEQLMAGKKVSHPYLGVRVTPADTGGAQITEVNSGGPAEKAGLKQGDVITKFGGRIINDSDDLVSAVQSGTVGQRVTVEFRRNGEQKTATVALGEAS